MDKIQIENCPFCSGIKVEPVEKQLKKDKSKWYVRCLQCNARGTLAGSMNDAIALWNRTPDKLEENMRAPHLFAINEKGIVVAP